MPIWYQEALEKQQLLPFEHCMNLGADYERERDNRRQERDWEQHQKKANALVFCKPVYADSVIINKIEMETETSNREVAVQLKLPPFEYQIRKVIGSGKNTEGIQELNKDRKKLVGLGQIQQELSEAMSTCPHIKEGGQCTMMLNSRFGLCGEWPLDKYCKIMTLRMDYDRIMKRNTWNYGKPVMVEKKEVPPDDKGQVSEASDSLPTVIKPSV